MSKYHKQIRSESVDVYDVLVAFGVTNPAVQHAIKKLLAPGRRGYKDAIQDLTEARQSIDRAIEIQKEMIEHGETCGLEDSPVPIGTSSHLEIDEDGKFGPWIEWKGGDCPMGDRDLVEYKMRQGTIGVGVIASSLDWNHDGWDGDIVAYRVVK